MKRTHLLLLLVTAVMTVLFPGTGYAEELSITGNGSDSDNDLQVSQNNTTNVDQSNASDVSNEISISSNTGENSASDNTGNTSITTGDVSNDINVSNSGNHSSVTESCCQSGSGSISISENGSGSENTASVTNNTSTNIILTNTAQITNTIYGRAVTGNNTANGNVGNTRIKTGDISIQQNIVSGSFNTNYVQIPHNQDGKNILMISENGSDSQNDIRFRNNASTLIATSNDTNIANTVLWDLITGNNSANWNVGDISIATGDIISKLTIDNGPINTNNVHIECCKKKPEHVTLPPTGGVISKSPGNPGSSNPGGEGARGGEVLGQAIGHILPATGTNWLFLALIGNIAMFFLGMYLRLRSGRSPGYVSVI